jgi:serine/threonine-protein kinase
MIGEIVGHYKILEKLGEGGMGIVYLARDMRLDRRVAVKFISSELAAKKEALRQFQEEARRASAIDHPNICTIYEIGHTVDKNLFLVMAFCRGQTLEKLLQENQCPKITFNFSDSIHIVMQICDALTAAHQVGLIHCDVKPQNIILSPEGCVKLIDFGIARLAEQCRKAGQDLWGSAAFISPERIQELDFDHRTDIWSVGVILYYLAFGRLPFRGTSTPELMYTIVNEEIQPAPGALQFEYEMLQSVLQKVLAKNPTERYDSMETLRHHLQQIQRYYNKAKDVVTPNTYRWA